MAALKQIAHNQNRVIKVHHELLKAKNMPNRSGRARQVRMSWLSRNSSEAGCSCPESAQMGTRVDDR